MMDTSCLASSAGLYLAVIENAAATVRSLIADSTEAGTTTEERLSHFAWGYATYIFGHPHLPRVLAREMPAGGFSFYEDPAKVRADQFTGCCAKSRGELRDIDFELDPISLIGSIVIFQLMRLLVSLTVGNLDYDERFIER